jgi:putative effector of murein hydrolase
MNKVLLIKTNVGTTYININDISYIDYTKGTNETSSSLSKIVIATKAFAFSFYGQGADCIFTNFKDFVNHSSSEMCIADCRVETEN